VPDAKRATGTSLTSFDEAAAQAFDELGADAGKHRPIEADVVRQWVESGGFVGRLQYHVELALRGMSAEAS
jgi:hypothetical protein